MIVHKKTREIEHKTVSDLKDFFVEGDVVVLNNTKVFSARLHANKEKNWRNDRGFSATRIR